MPNRVDNVEKGQTLAETDVCYGEKNIAGEGKKLQYCRTTAVCLRRKLKEACGETN